MFTWKEIIQIAIQIELNGEQTYRHAAEKVNAPHLARTLKHLADEESRHAHWFGRLTPSGSIPEEASDFEKLATIFLRETVSDQPFSLQEVDLTVVKSIQELIKTSIAFEGDTIQFYEMIRHFATSSEISALIDTIIAEEKKHVRILKQGLHKVSAKGSKGSQ